MEKSSSGCAIISPKKNQGSPHKVTRWHSVFGVDLRSLALFRISLGLIILGDLVIRSSNLKMFYTDSGTLPGYVLMTHFLDPHYLSLHLLNGSVLFQSLLFCFTGVIALCLVFGYRTGLMTFLCWVLTTSLHSRNPIILQGGDHYLRMLLFWGMFLPLGKRYSMDHALDSSEETKPHPHLSMASAALIVQIALVYLGSVGFKWQGADWHNGLAVMYALNIDQMTKPLALYLLPYPELLKFLTASVLWFEILGPLLFFVPFFFGPLRTALVLTFLGLHFGFILCLYLGLFPYVCAAALVVLLPGWLWDQLEQRVNKIRRPLRIFYDGECGFCYKAVLLIREFLLFSHATIEPAQSEPQATEEMQKFNSWIVVDSTGQRHYKFDAFAVVLKHSPILFWLGPVFTFPIINSMGRLLYDGVARNRSWLGVWTRGVTFRNIPPHESLPKNIFVGFCLVCVILWNVTEILSKPYLGPQWMRDLTLVLRLDQRWGLFAPMPEKEDGWYVIPGKLGDGSEVDLMTGGGPVRWEKPERVAELYKNGRETKYMMNLVSVNNSDYRLYYGRYLCRTWNENHLPPRQLQTFEINFMMEKTLPDGTVAPPVKWDLWHHYCFDPPEENTETE